ncbi:hypothetical protein HY212_04410 [Candidatus Pacearchaeota archaeon]|nr:hypothetical protein [Candidatus Pacearchaeota archaeon]
MTLAERAQGTLPKRNLDEDAKMAVTNAGYEIMMGTQHVSLGRLREAKKLVDAADSKDVKDYFDRICDNYTKKYGEIEW